MSFSNQSGVSSCISKGLSTRSNGIMSNIICRLESSPPPQLPPPQFRSSHETSTSPSSSTSSIYLDIMTPPLSTLLPPADDMQPLDLSLRAGRESEPIAKRSRLAEHKPMCLVKSCDCNLGNARTQRLSPYPLVTSSAARSPNTYVSLSPVSRTESPLYSQRQTPSPAYFSGLCSSNGTSPSVYYIPHSSQSTSGQAENSTFQTLPSDINHNDSLNPPGLFRHYDDRIYPSTIVRDHHQRPPPSSQLQEAEEEPPTYMDLDSTSSKSPYPKPSGGNYMHGSAKSDIIYVQRNSRKERVPRLLDRQESTRVLASCDKDGCHYSVMKTSAYVEGTVCQVPSGVSCPINESRGFEKVQHQENQQQISQQQQISHLRYCPLLPSPTGAVSSTTSQSTSPDHTHSISAQIRTMPNQCDVKFSSDAAFQPHRQTSPTSGQEADDASPRNTNSPINEESTATGNKNRKVVTSSFFQLSGIPSPGDVENARRNEEPTGSPSSSSLLSPSESKNSQDCTKISLLDFWISKTLLERSALEGPPQPTSKPCNVDYIHTVNGEKKIRLRLVDLIELQVEQSLKA